MAKRSQQVQGPQSAQSCLPKFTNTLQITRAYSSAHTRMRWRCIVCEDGSKASTDIERAVIVAICLRSMSWRSLRQTKRRFWNGCASPLQELEKSFIELDCHASGSCPARGCLNTRLFKRPSDWMLFERNHCKNHNMCDGLARCAVMSGTCCCFATTACYCCLARRAAAALGCNLVAQSTIFATEHAC